MDIKQFVEDAKGKCIDYLNEQLPSLLNREVNEIKIPFLRPDDVVMVLDKFGYEQEDMDTNGYEWTYRIYLKKGEDCLSIGGDGYYESFCCVQRESFA